MDRSFRAALVCLSLFALPCVAQRQSRGSIHLPEDVRAPIKEIPSKVLLRPSDGTHREGFGYSSAINSTGNIIAVGAPGDKTLTGAVYVFVKPNTGWADATQTTKLTVPGMKEDSEFGYAVAISSDGNTIVASEPYFDGAVYIFSPTGGSWSSGGTLVAKLTASDGGPGLGTSVAISGSGTKETIVAGAAWADPNSQGAVYVFVEPEAGWTSTTQTAKLTASNPGDTQTLGSAVAISGNVIAAGADDYNGGYGPGGVYVFTKPASGWANGTQTAELLASDAQGQDGLGSSIAISGDTIVAGALNHAGSLPMEGALYVFVEPTSGWVNAFQTAELTPSNGSENSQLGWSVAMTGSFIISGVGNVVDAYVKPASGWVNGTENYILTAPPHGTGGFVSISNSNSNLVAISADVGYDSIGAVDVFQK